MSGTNGRHTRAWVPLFFERARSMARHGQVNIKVAAECAGTTEINVYKFKCGRTPEAERFRAELSILLLQAKEVREINRRRAAERARSAEEDENLWRLG